MAFGRRQPVLSPREDAPFVFSSRVGTMMLIFYSVHFVGPRRHGHLCERVRQSGSHGGQTSKLRSG